MCCPNFKHNALHNNRLHQPGCLIRVKSIWVELNEGLLCPMAVPAPRCLRTAASPWRCSCCLFWMLQTWSWWAPRTVSHWRGRSVNGATLTTSVVTMPLPSTPMASPYRSQRPAPKVSWAVVGMCVLIEGFCDHLQDGHHNTCAALLDSVFRWHLIFKWRPVKFVWVCHWVMWTLDVGVC